MIVCSCLRVSTIRDGVSVKLRPCNGSSKSIRILEINKEFIILKSDFLNFFSVMIDSVTRYQLGYDNFTIFPGRIHDSGPDHSDNSEGEF